MARLVLHFDINGTITPVDTVEPGTKVENANMIIAKSVYGQVIDGHWILNDDIYDETDSLTYYDYLKQIDKQNYKKISFTFTDINEPGAKLHYMVAQLVDSMDKFLFNSFLKVLEAFPHALIVFRTFGLDADEVIHYLRTHDSTSRQFKNITTGTFTNLGDEYVLNLENGVSVTGMTNVNQLIKTSCDNLIKNSSDNPSSHLVFKENFHYWNEHNRNKAYGKQLLGDGYMFQIFFDDNDCVNVTKNNPATHNIRVNTLRAMLDDMYYIDRIYKCIMLMRFSD